MSIWNKLFTLGRAGVNDTATAVVDKNAIRILDQEVRDAEVAQGKARDSLATLVARRRILEQEIKSLTDQVTKYENSARAAVTKGDMDLARQVAQRSPTLRARSASRGRRSSRCAPPRSRFTRPSRPPTARSPPSGARWRS
jgi:phage shock protein A